MAVALDALVGALRLALPPEVEAAPPAPQAVDPEALRVAVARLEDLLSQDAVEAIDVFDGSAPLWRPPSAPGPPRSASS